MTTYAGRYGAAPLHLPSGAAAVGQPVTVHTTGGAAASLWADKDRAVPLPNPVAADDLGNLTFYADPGEYDLIANGGQPVRVAVENHPAEPGGGGGGGSKIVKARYVATGSITPPLDGTWAPLAGFELSAPASAGQWATVDMRALWNPNPGSLYDLTVVVGSSIVRFAATGTASPALESAPAWYPQPNFVTADGAWSWQIAPGDLDGSNVRVALAHHGNAAGTLFADADYPFWWSLTVESGVTVL